MPDIATALKDEIRRLARKEIKAETSKTKAAVVQYRHEIASLKRQLDAQQKEISRLKTQGAQGEGQQEAAEPDELEGVRFSARSVRAQRKRLGLSAADYGRLVGVSGLTIYGWEKGTSRPRRAQLLSLVAVRGIGKREALAQIAAAKNESPGEEEQPAPKRRRRAKKVRSA